MYIFLFFRKELKLLWFVKQTDEGWGRQDRLLYWPINSSSSLDHSTLCCLQGPLSTSAASRPGLLNRRPDMGHNPQLAHSQWLPAGFDSPHTESNSLNWRRLNWRQQPSVGRSHWLQDALTLAFTASNWLISIYYFITSAYFRLDHIIFFRLFTQVRLWRLSQGSIFNTFNDRGYFLCPNLSGFLSNINDNTEKYSSVKKIYSLTGLINNDK